MTTANKIKQRLRARSFSATVFDNSYPKKNELVTKQFIMLDDAIAAIDELMKDIKIKNKQQ